MIPDLVSLPGAPFHVLPPGIHWASLNEVAEQFAYNGRRTWLFEGITSVARALAVAGCEAMYLDGSFISSKPEPADFDGCWDPRGVRADDLDPLLLDFESGCKRQKRAFHGEMFISTAAVGSGSTFFEFFQIEKHTGIPKGLVALNPAKLALASQ